MRTARVKPTSNRQAEEPPEPSGLRKHGIAEGDLVQIAQMADVDDEPPGPLTEKRELILELGSIEDPWRSQQVRRELAAGGRRAGCPQLVRRPIGPANQQAAGDIAHPQRRARDDDVLPGDTLGNGPEAVIHGGVVPGEADRERPMTATSRRLPRVGRVVGIDHPAVAVMTQHAGCSDHGSLDREQWARLVDAGCFQGWRCTWSRTTSRYFSTQA